MAVKLENYSKEVKEAIEKACILWLFKVSGYMTSQVKQNTKVKSGHTKANWSYVVDKDNLTAQVGNVTENAIWEEFGTGEYALNGDGRKGGWRYKDDEDKWVFTRGKKPRRPLFHAFNTKKKGAKELLLRMISNALGV